MNKPVVKLSCLSEALLLMMAWGCADSSLPEGVAFNEDEPRISMTLHIPADPEAPASRAFPTGGIDGDGRESALDCENAVVDANLFFFNGESLNPVGIDPEDIMVSGVFVDGLSSLPLDDDNDPSDKKITVNVKISDTNLNEADLLGSDPTGFVVVLNAGCDLSGEITDLRQLREYILTPPAADEDDVAPFLMTTAYDADANGSIKIDGVSRYVGSNRLEKSKILSGDSGPVWAGEATVQRLCARIDIMCKAENIGASQLIFSSADGSKVRITNIHPVNFMQTPSYLLTKTTVSIPDSWSLTGLGDIIWGGTELTEAGSDRPMNYIIEPSTLDKAAGSKSFDRWYGSTAAAEVIEAMKDCEVRPFKEFNVVDIPATSNVGFDRSVIIGYSHENISAPCSYSSDYITGIALCSLYQPAHICRMADGEFVVTPLSDAEWDELPDKTFWRYSPASGAVGENIGSQLYFLSENDLQAYLSSHPADQAEVVKYGAGVCYYNLWLRHYNDESYMTAGALPKEIRPMEFSIVRNNIYRVSLTFSGAGDAAPGLREPDTMKSRIYVRKWNRREETNALEF